MHLQTGALTPVIRRSIEHSRPSFRGEEFVMANVASVLKEEIARVARKEIRAETQSLKKAVSLFRTEIAALKRRSQALEQELKRLGRPPKKTGAVAAEDSEPRRGLRFSAKGLASQRARLGLSAADCGLLIGASGQSIYNWEAGTAHPRARHLAAIAELRSMGKKEAAARLASSNAQTI
jgi:DNA-binding XRE family transcriptional regulator